MDRFFRQAAQKIFVVEQRQRALLIKHADLRQVVTATDLKVVEVMCRRDLHRARTLFRIGIFVGDDRNLSSDQRQDHVLTDQMRVALIVRMHRNCGVTQHRLRPGRSDHDISRGIDGIEGLAFQRIAQIPQATLDLDLLHLKVGDGRQQLGVPVNEALVFVDQPFAMQFDEHLDDGARQAFVHSEAFARPVTGRP